MNICDSCNNNFHTQYDKFYTNQYKNLCDIFKNTIINNNDIIYQILSFLTYKNHIVSHQKKKRIIPTPEQEEDSDFDDEIYWIEKKNICTFCFQTGLIESLKIQNRLPFLRRDIYYFINENRDIDECLKIYQDKYDNFFLFYELPKYYENTYYRQEKPLSISNNKFIIFKNSKN